MSLVLKFFFLVFLVYLNVSFRLMGLVFLFVHVHARKAEIFPQFETKKMIRGSILILN